MKTSNFLTLSECVKLQLSSQAQPVTEFTLSPVFMKRRALLGRNYDQRTALHTAAPDVLPEVPSRPVSSNNIAQSLYTAYAKARKSNRVPRERNPQKTDNAGFSARQGQFRSGGLFTKDSAYKCSLFPAAPVSIQLKELTELYAQYQQISETQNRKLTYKKATGLCDQPNDVKAAMCREEAKTSLQIGAAEGSSMRTAALCGEMKREIQKLVVLGNRKGKRPLNMRKSTAVHGRQKSETARATPRQSRKSQRTSPEPSVLSGISQLLIINYR